MKSTCSVRNCFHLTHAIADLSLHYISTPLPFLCSRPSPFLMRKTFYCNVVPLVLHSLERWDKMLLVFYSSGFFCGLQGHSGSQFKIRQEDKTQAFWAHWHALLLYLIFEPVPLYVIMSSFFSPLLSSVQHFISFSSGLFFPFHFCSLFHAHVASWFSKWLTSATEKVATFLW